MFAFQKIFPSLVENELLSKHCTFKIGGPADYFIEIQDFNELPELLKIAKQNNIPYFIFGAGSNILFHDKGFRGLVIKISAKEIFVKENTIKAQSGALIATLINTMIEHGLSGLEPWIGLPGTVGGAVYGNAGCNGLETADCLIETQVFDTSNEKIINLTPHHLEFSYRHSNLKNSSKIILSATFKAFPLTTSPQIQQEQINQIRQKRFQIQPFGVCTTGSFFKNPSPEKPAGLLIDQAGLKGKTLGGAQISEKHANFFINKKNATAKDILALKDLAQATVKQKFNLQLQPEVQIIPETPIA